MAQGNDLFDIIHTTRAMRRLKPDPVPDELVQRILEAGTCAPTKGDEPTLLCGMTRMTSMNRVPARDDCSASWACGCSSHPGFPLWLKRAPLLNCYPGSDFRNFFTAGRLIWNS